MVFAVKNEKKKKKFLVYALVFGHFGGAPQAGCRFSCLIIEERVFLHKILKNLSGFRAGSRDIA